MQDTAAYVRAQAAAARNAYYAVSAADSSAKNAALLRTAELLDKHRTAILAANRQDMENAEAKGLDAAMLDRLQLSDAGIDNICEGLRQIAALPDPVGEMTNSAPARTAFKSAKCAYRSASSASSTNRGRT